MYFIYLLLLQISIFSLGSMTEDITYNHLKAHLVSLRTLKYIYQPGDNHFCTGVILTDRHVLTAAHCVTDNIGFMVNPKRIMVAFSSPLYKSPETEEILVDIESMVIHPDYWRNSYHDLALIKLRKSMKFDGRHLSNVSVGTSELEIGKDCKTISATRRHIQYSLVLTDVSLRPLEECAREKPTLRQIQEHGQELVCVTSLENHTCLTDFGGPLFCDGQLYGIAMGSINCSVPIFFSYVPRYAGWLKEIISQGVELQPHHKCIFSLPLLVYTLGNFHFGQVDI